MSEEESCVCVCECVRKRESSVFMYNQKLCGFVCVERIKNVFFVC